MLKPALTILSLLLSAGAAHAEPTYCWQAAGHGMADAAGNVTWAPIFKGPDDLTPDPHFDGMNLGNSTDLVLSSVREIDGAPILIGRLYFRGEPFVDRDIATPQSDWNCRIGSYVETDRAVPNEVKGAAARLIKASLVDPYSVRSAGFGPVFMSQEHPASARIACVSFNAKNRMGGYAGISMIPVMFYENGQKVWVPEGVAPCQGRSPSGPFEELGRAD